MKWVTRRSIRVNRVATAWLIRRFIDPRVHFRRAVKYEALVHRMGDAQRANIPRRLRFARREEADDVSHVAAAH